MTKDWQTINSVLKNKVNIKPPAHEWQELALGIIDQLAIPDFKRSAVFQVCKTKPKNIIQAAVNDTKELCSDGPKWKYFFKIINQ